VSKNNVFLDLTELLKNPVRTGIQRVEREIIRHWPGPATLVPCHFDAASRDFVAISESIFDILEADSKPAEVAQRTPLQMYPNALGALSRRDLSAGLFNPELFFDAGRAAAYREICREPGTRVSWLLFDFLPYLYPENWSSGTSLGCMYYIRALREVPRVSFISELTGVEYTRRIMRDPARTGPHFPLGGDSLQLEKQRFSPDKISFAYIGTIEPRKNVGVILEAFEQLWANGIDAELTIVGRMESCTKREISALRRVKSERRFKYLGHVDDATVRSVLREVRATLFVSAAEGFGIPPYESLAAGVPVIVSSKLPSIDLLAPGGRITVPEITPHAVAAAVSEMLNNATAARLWSEAGQITIPTWHKFVHDVAEWVQAG
jgi:glycosyltransferase involved in cell wall biosynthesis